MDETIGHHNLRFLALGARFGQIVEIVQRVRDYLVQYILLSNLLMMYAILNFSQYHCNRFQSQQRVDHRVRMMRFFQHNPLERSASHAAYPCRFHEDQFAFVEPCFLRIVTLNECHDDKNRRKLSQIERTRFMNWLKVGKLAKGESHAKYCGSRQTSS